MESLINRVRVLLSYDLSVEEIVESCSDFSVEAVFLAYHAAKILDSDS